MKQVRDDARRRKGDPVVLSTPQAIGMLSETIQDTNTVLHLTC
jgi:hypothetical protein